MNLKFIGAPENITKEMIREAKKSQHLLVSRVYVPNKKSEKAVVRNVMRGFEQAGLTNSDLTWIMVTACSREMTDYELLEFIKHENPWI